MPCHFAANVRPGAVYISSMSIGRRSGIRHEQPLSTKPVDLSRSPLGPPALQTITDADGLGTYLHVACQAWAETASLVARQPRRQRRVRVAPA